MKSLAALLAGACLPLTLLSAVPASASEDPAHVPSRPTALADTGSSILPVLSEQPGFALSARATAAASPRVSEAWKAIRMPRVPARIDGTGIVVAVIDSGVEALVPNLRGRVLPGKDFNDIPTKRGWSDPVAFGGHGTGVASIIVGKGRGSGVPGVAPGARVLPVRVANQFGVSPDPRIGRAIRWAVAQKVDVINLSMGSKKPNDVLNAAIRYAVRKGVIFVAGAGNDGPDNPGPFFPASIPAAIAVGGTQTKTDRVAAFSCRGDWVDLVAPATWVPNTQSDGSTDYASGTSYASPFVAGVAALMLQANPDLRQDEVRDILTSTARDVMTPGFDTDTGYGLLDAAEAVKRARDLHRNTTR